MPGSRSIARGALAGLALAAGSGCSISLPAGLLYLPADLLSWWSDARQPITYAANPGPLEAALYEHAQEQGELGLLIDTPDSADDLKLLARRCEGGDDAPACTRLADTALDWLGAVQLGELAELAACRAGAAERCTLLFAAGGTQVYPGGRGRRSAWEFYLRACLAREPIVRACRFAAAAVSDVYYPTSVKWFDDIGWDGLSDTERQPWPEYWACEDRACVLGDRQACASLAEVFSRSADVHAVTIASPQLAAAGSRYYAALESIAGGTDAGAGEPGLGVARKLLEAELREVARTPRCFTAASPR
jgi:hypothetical protein